ncbi:MAG: GNAT family N-acetyltransferase [Planctomycetota bacterium]
MVILTERLRIIPVSRALAVAELQDRIAFASLLDAEVPADWPPDSLADALLFFLGLMAEHPDWLGWLGWYAIACDKPTPTLIGSIGFKGPPRGDGEVEIGYSVLPKYRRFGYATEMARGLVHWARSVGGVQTVIAQTTDDNLGSHRLLLKLGFVPSGQGEDAGSTLYRLVFAERA